MKKQLLLLICISWTILSNAQDRPKVLATASMISDMAQVIAGDKLEIGLIVPVGGDPHLYEPTPKDASKIYKSDLVLKNGMTFEGWITELIETSGTKAEVVTVTNGINAIQSLDYANSVDPHAWMDVKNGLVYIDNINKALKKLDPANAEYFQLNYETYRKELIELDRYISDRIKEIPAKKRVLITSHDAFQYYGRAYGLELKSVLGTSTDAEVQTSDISSLYNAIEVTGVPAIFVETTINPKLLEQVAEDNGIVIGGSLYADSIGPEGSDGDSYFNMMKVNTDKIANALSVKSESGYVETKQEDSLLKRVILFGLIGFLFVGGFLMMLFRLRKTATGDIPPDLPDHEAISINGLSVSYDKKVVLSNIYCEIASGKVYGVLGPNGAGKSTLFKSILGLIEPSSGTIKLHGFEPEVQKRRIAYVPQKNDVDWSFPATVKDIVEMGRYPHLTPMSRLSKSDNEIVANSLSELGIEHLAQRQIGELSGGQQQRVFLARALAQQADIFLLDEPFVGVDITTEGKIIGLLKKLAAQNKTLLVVHHDLSTVKEYFDSVILLNQRLIAAGPTENTFTEENLSTAYRGQLPILHKTVGE